MMKNIFKGIIGLMAVFMFLLLGCQDAAGPESQAAIIPEKFKKNWRSLKQHTTPQWLRDGKFGIYTHWGVYAVHAMGKNATWYSHNVYMDPDGWERKDFEKKYGKLSDGAGYKDLIPMFTAEKFDAEQWAELFAWAGAKFAGPLKNASSIPFPEKMEGIHCTGMRSLSLPCWVMISH